jgi:mono/diheme cytochrome c family protein
MSSSLLAQIHYISALAFLVIYLIKTVLLFTSVSSLDRFAAKVKVPEMIISTLFLVTGIWLLVILGGIKVIYIIKLAMVFVAIPLAVIGFKKKKKALAFLSFLLIVGSFGMAEAGKKKPFIQSTAIVDNDGSRLNNGKKVYLENCAYCHGNDGKKAYRGAPDLSGGRNEGYTAQVVTDGKKGDIGVMPAYGGTLSFDEIADVALYIAAMGKTTPAPVTE